MYKFSVKLNLHERKEKAMDNDISTLESLKTKDETDIIELLPAAPLKYEKSNMLIYGRYKMSKMAQKTLAYALSTLRGRCFTDHDMEMGVSVNFTSAEIKSVLVNPNAARRGTLSRELKDIAASLHGTTIFIMDEEDGDFVSFPFIKTCKYKNDSFQITFHENMSPFLVNLDQKGNFTVLDVNHIKGMHSGYTIRIYEICKSLAYLAKAHNGIIIKKFDIIEFKLMIGLIDSESPAIRAITSQYKKDYYMIGQKIEELYEDSLKAIDEIDEKLRNASDMPLTTKQMDDYIKALQKSKKAHSEKITKIHMYRSVTELRRRVLEVAKKELSKMMDDGVVDVCFDYEMLKKNHTIYGFQMVVLTKEGRENYKKQKESNRQLSLYDYAHFNDSGSKKKKSTNKVDNPDSRKEMVYCKKEEVPDTLDMLESYFNTHSHKIRLTLKDMYKLACLVDSDIIIEKFEQMENAGDVRNPIGWMIAAIKENYQKPTDVPKRNSFSDFEQNTYNFDELEKDLLAN